MNSGIKYYVARPGGAVTQCIYMCVLLFAAHVTHAIPITGSMGVGGGYSASGGTDLSDATFLELNSVFGTSASGDLGTTVGFFTPGTINNGSFSINPFAPPQTNLFVIGGWQLDLSDLSITDQTTRILTMEGTGVLSGNGFDDTNATWSFSAQGTGSSYSMTINSLNTVAKVAVSEPGVLALLGLGLMGIGATGRKMNKQSNPTRNNTNKA